MNVESPTLLLLHQGAIGDFILALSTVRAVQIGGRSTQVIAVAGNPAGRWAEQAGHMTKWFPPDRVGLHTLFGETAIHPDLASLFRTADLVISFLGQPHEPHHRKLAQYTRHWACISPSPTPETFAAGRHITAQWSADLGTQGIPLLRVRSLSEYPAKHRPEVSAGPCAGRWVLHPGSGGRTKCWPAERFLQLADRLGSPHVAWMIGPVEREQQPDVLDALHERVRHHGDALICEPDLVLAADTLGGARCYVGNDAGMTHLAAAMGIPTLAIFRRTDPRIWRPLGAHAAWIGSVTSADRVTDPEIDTVYDAAVLLASGRSPLEP